MSRKNKSPKHLNILTLEDDVKNRSLYYELYTKTYGVDAAEEMWYRRTHQFEEIQFTPEERENLRGIKLDDNFSIN